MRFDQFNESSLDIFSISYCYYIWGISPIKEDVNFKIMEILEQEGVSIAFPSRSLPGDTGRC